MSARHKVIARRHDTTVPHGSDTGRSSARMPEEILSDQIRRLIVFAGTAGAVWSFGLFMDIVVLPAAGRPGGANWRSIGIEAVAALTALVMWAYLRLSPAAHAVKMNVGFVFMIA